MGKKGLIDLEQLTAALIPVSKNDRILVRSWNTLAGSTFVVRARILNRKGEIEPQDFTEGPTSDQLLTSDSFGLSDGILVGLTVRPTVDTKRGETYCEIRLGLGSTATFFDEYRLCRGYVAVEGGPKWPFGIDEPAVAGRGFLRSITGTNPAAGSEIQETVGSNLVQKLLSLRASLVLDTNTPTRFPTLRLDDGTTVYFDSGTTTGHGANASLQFHWFPGAPVNVNSANHITLPLSNNRLLKETFRINTEVTNLQVGDDWSAPQYLVEEWLEP